MFFSISLLNLFVLPLCGAMESGIIGGTVAKPHSHPYMASVQINNKHVCGGMLIRPDYVLTAAHCVDNITFPGKDILEVVLGAHNISRNEREQQRIQVKEIFKHPCYKKNKRQDDIMILKLKTKARLNKDVNVFKLPKNNENIPANQKCSIAGWGKTTQNSAESSVLREATLKVQFNFECKKIWNETFDSATMICSVSDGKRAFCQGDSGSPLICDNIPQGLAAYTFGGNCLNKKYPEVYMKISYYFPWIKTIIR